MSLLDEIQQLTAWIALSVFVTGTAPVGASTGYSFLSGNIAADSSFHVQEVVFGKSQTIDV